MVNLVHSMQVMAEMDSLLMDLKSWNLGWYRSAEIQVLFLENLLYMAYINDRTFLRHIFDQSF
jgi:hypothetical protein